MTSFRNSSKSNRDSFVSVLKRVIRDALHGSAPSNRKSKIYRRKPGFEGLEDRRLLVIGAFDIPVPILAGEGFDFVAKFNNATGALLSSARHLLTAAHTGLPGSAAAAKFVVLGPNGDDWFLSDNLDDLLDRAGGETKN